MTLEENFNLTGLTDHEIILFVRDTLLKDLELIKRFYPGFVAKSKNCQSRDELIDLVKETYHKTKALTDTQFLDQFEKNGRTKVPVEENITSVATGEKSTTTNNLERESFDNNNSSTLQKNGYENNESLSVWERIQYFLKNPQKKKDDPLFCKRLQTYTKRALFIIQVIDTYGVFSVGEAWRKAQEAQILNMKSMSTVGDLLNDLAIDEFLDMQIIERPKRIDTHLYCICGYKERFPKKYEIKTNRHKIGHPKNQTSKKLDTIKAESKTRSIAMSEGFAEARKERKHKETEVLEATKRKHEESKERAYKLSDKNLKTYKNMQKKLKERLEENIPIMGKKEALDEFTKQNKMLTEGMIKQDQAAKNRLQGVVK